MSKQSAFVAATLTAVLAAGSIAAAQGRITASATGSGHLTINGTLRTFAFAANRDASGNTKGQMEVINRDQDIRVHATINCLNVIGNTAIMSGPVTKSSNPALEDTQLYVKVVDNGEGANSPGDRLTLAFTVASTLTCDVDLNIPFLPLEKGNIQIRP